MDSKADHYKLLGIEPNASEVAIRQAYLKKALECHPDKRNNDVHAERMFKEINKAYETLSNKSSRYEYDAKREDDDDEDTILLDVFQLPTGKRPSQAYEEKLANWTAEYPRQTFIDNVDTVMESITKTILQKYQDDFNATSLPPTICSICSEQCQDLTEHFVSKQKKYMMCLEKMRESNSSLNEQLAALAPDDWSWKPVDPPALMFQDLWTDTKWTDIPRLMDDLSPALLILKDSTSTQIKMNNEIEQNVQIFCEVPSIDYQPDITSFITAIDNENRSQRQGPMRNINEDNEHRVATGSHLSIVNNVDANGPLDQLCYDVKAPPATITDDSTCSDCQKTLSYFLFRGRYHCRMCGQTQCRDCQRWQTCRHLGYTWPVRICQACASRKTRIIIDVIHSNIEQSLVNHSTQYLPTYIALLNHYSPQNNSIYESIEKHFLVSQNFVAVMQCFTYRRAPCKAWFTLAETACLAEAFVHAFTCFNAISLQFRYTTEQWSKVGDDYCTKGNAPLALFSYRQAKLSHEQVWLKSVLKLDGTLIALYATAQARQANKFDAWIKWLTRYLIDKNLDTSAILTLQLAELNASQWTPILDDLASNRQFMTVIILLKTISKMILNEIMSKATNPFVQLACCALCNATKILDLCLIHPQANIDKLLISLVIVHVLQQPDWNALQTQYFRAHEFDKVLICYKFRNSLHLCRDDDLSWIETALNANESFAYLMKSLTTSCDYIQLAEAYASKSNRFEIALNYYMLQLNASPTISTVLSIIKSTTLYLPTSQALRCHLAIYKQTKSDRTILPKILETICNDLQKLNKPIMNFLIECILILKKISVLDVPFHSQLLDKLAEHFEKNFDVIGAALHFLSNTDLPTQKPYELDVANRYRRLILDNVHATLKLTVYMSIIQLAAALSKTTSVIVLEKIHHECFGDRKMDTTPGDYRAKMYLVEGVISKLKGQCFDAIGRFHQAMVCSPSEETATALVILMSNSTFHQALIKELLSAITILPINGLKSILAAPIQPPPSEFAAENYLTANIRINLVRKYERAILKRLNNDSLQSALSYIDMCDAVHDPTCLVSNWTIASMYFFDLLVKANSSPGQEAQVYAYRNMIEELACQSFAISRHFLPPHIQTYIFRLLLTLLIETNTIFRSSVARHCSGSRNILPIISERQSNVITQLLNFTVHLTKVSPFMQLPTSLSYDVLYLEAVGQRLLVNFLEAVADRSYMNVYYLFEGIWQGWARNQSFNEMRLKCMQALLATKGWDLFDVQLLLDIPLIPRTNDGWLYRERRQLTFSSTQRFSKADGIAFDTVSGEVQFLFQPVTMKLDDAMFDSNDVVEVFQRGLTSCLFTLNQPDNDFHAHPFQEMLYYPSSLLYTQYCATLLHTDYLLKMFTTGTEVCAKPPFEMRSISESFFQRLPAHLQEKLKPLHDREQNFSFGRAHRFWIEADEVVYERKLIGTQIQYRVADVRLRVRKHLLIRDGDGKLVDDEEANESEVEKCSTESQFAKVFTDHYDEIGSYFPELLRLKELLKLSALYVFTISRYEHLKEPVNPYPIKVHLVELRQKIDYPQATDTQVDEYYNAVLSKNGISSWDVSSDEEQSARTMIRSQLEGIDRQIVDGTVENICEQAHTLVSSTARSCVQAWLNDWYDGAERLARFIANGLTARDYALMRPIEQLEIRIHENENKYDAMKHADVTCNWVPAVFLNKVDSGMRIYGGVNLQLKLSEGRVPVNNMTSRYNAVSIFASPKNVSTTGPRNKQEYHVMKQNLVVESAKNGPFQNASGGNTGDGGGNTGSGGENKGGDGRNTGTGGGSKGGDGGNSSDDGDVSSGNENGRKPSWKEPWLSPTMKVFLSENKEKVKKAETSPGKSEATPAVPRNVKFITKTHSNKKYNERSTDGHIFVEDLSHYNSNPSKSLPHYEEYKNLRDFEKGKRYQSVTWDGNIMVKFP